MNINMRKITNILFVLLFIGLTSCTDSSNGSKVSFSNSVYRLSAEEPLNITINSTEAVEKDLTISFTISGTAKQDVDYIISSKQVVIKAGATAGIVTITPKGNYDASKNIILRLESSSNYSFGPNMVTSIAVQQKEKLITSFTQDNYLVKDTVEVEMNFKGYNDEYGYTSLSEIRIPFTIDTENSTAIKDVNFTIVDNATEFVVAPGKHNATIKIAFIGVDNKVDRDHNKLVLKLTEFAENIILGTYDETTVTILGPTTEGALYGKWAFDSEANKEDYIASWGDMLDDDLPKLPIPSKADTLEFVFNGKSKLITHLESGLTNYFRTSYYSYAKEDVIHVGNSFPPVKLNVTYMNMEEVNYFFSSTSENIKVGMVGFALSEDKETLKVIINDYYPTDFFTLFIDYGMVTDTPPISSYSPLIYTFKKVKE